MLLRPVTFGADVDLTFDAGRVVDKDNKRWLVIKNKLWFNETVVGQDEDEQIIERGGAGRRHQAARHAADAGGPEHCHGLTDSGDDQLPNGTARAGVRV